MEVLRPPLINIDGRMYRRNIIKEEHYQEEDDFSCTGPLDNEELAADEICDTHFIEQTDRGYRCAVDVPSVLYKYIIGKKGETRRRIESDTKTSISIPKPGLEGQIVITGSHKAAVSSAVTRIEVLVENFRRKQPFTHFLSFPLNDPKIQEGFLRFKDKVLQNSSQDHGVEESIFQNPAKLHLTIGTLSLLNDTEVKQACEHLQECQTFIRDITEGKPLPLEVSGIEYMNDDPAVVDVLYAKVNVKDRSDNDCRPAGRALCLFRADGQRVGQSEATWDRDEHAFQEGLHSYNNTFLKTSGIRQLFQCLATALFTCTKQHVFQVLGQWPHSFWPKIKLAGEYHSEGEVEDTSGPGRQNMSEREAFDARNILKKFDSYYFGEFKLNSVQLSQRYSADCTGYYSSAGGINFS